MMLLKPALIFTIFLQQATANPSNAAAESLPFLCTNCNKSLSSWKNPAKLTKIPCKSAMVSCKCTPPTCAKALKYHLEVCDVTIQNGRKIEEFRKICQEVSCSYFQVGTKKNWKLIYFQKKPYPGIQKNSSSSFHVDPQLVNKIDCQLEPKKEDGILKTTRKKMPKYTTKAPSHQDWTRGLMGKPGAKGRSVFPKSAPQTVKPEIRKEKQKSVTKGIKIGLTTKARGFHEAVVKSMTSKMKPPKVSTVKHLSNVTRISTAGPQNHHLGKSKSLKPRHTNTSSKKPDWKALIKAQQNSTQDKYWSSKNHMTSRLTHKRMSSRRYSNASSTGSARNPLSKMSTRRTLKMRVSESTPSTKFPFNKTKKGGREGVGNRTTKHTLRNTTKIKKRPNGTTKSPNMTDITKATRKWKCKGDKNRTCDQPPILENLPLVQRCVIPPHKIEIRIVCTGCSRSGYILSQTRKECVLTQILCVCQYHPYTSFCDKKRIIIGHVCNMSHYSMAELKSPCDASCPHIQAKSDTGSDYMILHGYKILAGFTKSALDWSVILDTYGYTPEKFCRVTDALPLTLVRDPPLCKHPQQFKDMPNCIFPSFAATGTLSCSQCDPEAYYETNPPIHVSCTIKQLLCHCTDEASCTDHGIPYLHLAYCEVTSYPSLESLTSANNPMRDCFHSKCTGRQITLPDKTMYPIYFPDSTKLHAGIFHYLGAHGESTRIRVNQTLEAYCSTASPGFQHVRNPDVCEIQDFSVSISPKSATTTRATEQTSTTTPTIRINTLTTAAPRTTDLYKNLTLVCMNPTSKNLYVTDDRRYFDAAPLQSFKSRYPSIHCGIRPYYECPSTCERGQCSRMGLPKLHLCFTSTISNRDAYQGLITACNKANLSFLQARDKDQTPEFYQIAAGGEYLPATLSDNSLTGEWNMTSRSKEKYCEKRQAGPVCFETAILDYFGSFCSGGFDEETDTLGRLKCDIVRIVCEDPENRILPRVCLTVCSISGRRYKRFKEWNETVTGHDCKSMQVRRGNERFFVLYEYKQLAFPDYNILSGGKTVYNRNGHNVSFELYPTTKEGFCLSQGSSYRMAKDQFASCDFSCSPPQNSKIPMPRWCSNVKEQKIPPRLIRENWDEQLSYDVYAGKFDRLIRKGWNRVNESEDYPLTRLACTSECTWSDQTPYNAEFDTFATDFRFVEVFCTPKAIVCTCKPGSETACGLFENYVNLPNGDSTSFKFPICALPTTFPLDWLKPGGNWSDICKRNNHICKYPVALRPWGDKSLLFYSCKTGMIYPGALLGFSRGWYRSPTFTGEISPIDMCTEAVRDLKVLGKSVPEPGSYVFTDIIDWYD